MGPQHDDYTVIAERSCMENQICVSSYSLRQQLGPIHVVTRGPDGQKSSFDWDQPQTMTLLEFPA